MSVHVSQLMASLMDHGENLSEEGRKSLEAAVNAERDFTITPFGGPLDPRQGEFPVVVLSMEDWTALIPPDGTESVAARAIRESGINF